MANELGNMSRELAEKNENIQQKIECYKTKKERGLQVHSFILLIHWLPLQRAFDDNVPSQREEEEEER